MALSDQLLRLSDQAKHLEASASAVKAKDKEKITQRKAALHTSIESARVELGNEMIADGDQAAADWAADKKEISDGFQSLRDKRADRHAKWSAKRAERSADDAEDEALDDIDFAIYAIEEAEYALLDAVDARADADAKAAAVK